MTRAIGIIALHEIVVAQRLGISALDLRVKYHSLLLSQSNARVLVIRILGRESVSVHIDCTCLERLASINAWVANLFDRETKTHVIFRRGREEICNCRLLRWHNVVIACYFGVLERQVGIKAQTCAVFVYIDVALFAAEVFLFKVHSHLGVVGSELMLLHRVIHREF